MQIRLALMFHRSPPTHHRQLRDTSYEILLVRLVRVQSYSYSNRLEAAAVVTAMDVSTRESPYATADIAERGDARRSLEETDDRWRREHAVDAPGGYQHARVMAVTGQIERRWRVQRDRALIRRIQNPSPSTTRVWTPQEAHAQAQRDLFLFSVLGTECSDGKKSAA